MGDPGGYGKPLLIGGFELKSVLAIPGLLATLVTISCPLCARSRDYDLAATSNSSRRSDPSWRCLYAPACSRLGSSPLGAARAFAKRELGHRTRVSIQACCSGHPYAVIGTDYAAESQSG